MGNRDMKILNALGNETRLKMCRCLNEKDMHISKLARELSVSIPVVSKHANVLEDADLICRKVFGKTHVLSIKNRKRDDSEAKATISNDYQKILTTIESLRKITTTNEK